MEILERAIEAIAPNDTGVTLKSRYVETIACLTHKPCFSMIHFDVLSSEKREFLYYRVGREISCVFIPR